MLLCDNNIANSEIFPRVCPYWSWCPMTNQIWIWNNDPSTFPYETKTRENVSAVDTLDVTRNLDVSLDCACSAEKVYWHRVTHMTTIRGVGWYNFLMNRTGDDNQEEYCSTLQRCTIKHIERGITARGVACRTHVRRCFHIDLTILKNKNNFFFFFF